MTTNIERERPVFTIGDQVVIDGSDQAVIIGTNVLDPHIAWDRIEPMTYDASTRSDFLGQPTRRLPQSKPHYPDPKIWKYKIWVPLGAAGAQARNHGEGVLGKFFYVQPTYRTGASTWTSIEIFGSEYVLPNTKGEKKDRSVFEDRPMVDERFLPYRPFPASWDWEETIKNEWPLLLERAKQYAPSTWRYFLRSCFPGPEIDRDRFSPDFTLDVFCPTRKMREE